MTKILIKGSMQATLTNKYTHASKAGSLFLNVKVIVWLLIDSQEGLFTGQLSCICYSASKRDIIYAFMLETLINLLYVQAVD